MTSNEFTLWLHGYLEALETEGIEKIKIKNIREKMGEIKNSPNQERVLFGSNANQQQSSYAPKSSPTNRSI